ncbi:MAG: ABC transporter permease subunit, partial [Mycobacteriales bacterium]
MTRVSLPAAPWARRVALGVGSVLAIGLITQFALPSGGISGRGVPIAVDVEGLIAGLVDALIAAGLVLIFRTNRILNFTAQLLGVPGGLLAFELLRFSHANFVLATLVALVVGGALGALVDIVFGRRFARTSRLLYTVATIFVGGVLTFTLESALLAVPLLPPASARPVSVLAAPNALAPYLPLPGLSIHVGSFPIPFGFGDVFTVEACIVALLGLGAVLRFTRAGVALRSVAQNPERAATLGVSAGAISTLAWTLAGVLAALAVLGNGFTGDPGIAVGQSPSLQALLLPAAAAVLARFRSIPLAAAWSVGLSVLVTAIGFAVADPNPYVYGGELAIIVGGLLLQRRELYRLSGTESWRLAAEQKPLPRELAALPGVRATRYLGAAAIVLVAVGLPVVVGAGTVSQLQSILLTGILGLSLVVLTGWGGQASFGQYAFAAVGAVVAGGATARGGVPFLLAVPLGVVVAAACAFVVGLPALRVRGLFLGVATYAFPKLFGWLLPTAIPRPRVFVSFDGETPFYYLCLAVLLVCVVVVVNLRRSRFGRVLIACRDNDAALQAAGVPVVRTRLVAFAVSGGLAGLAGALLAFQLRTVTSSAFSADTSLFLFVYVVV